MADPDSNGNTGWLGYLSCVVVVAVLGYWNDSALAAAMWGSFVAVAGYPLYRYFYGARSDRDRRIDVQRKIAAGHEASLRRGADFTCQIKLELPVLDFCIEELEERSAAGGPTDWVWTSKLKVARLLRREWCDRVNIEPHQLTDDEKARVRAEHPLLQDWRVRPQNSPDHYAEEGWFKQIRSEVMEYIAKDQARSPGHYTSPGRTESAPVVRR